MHLVVMHGQGFSLSARNQLDKQVLKGPQVDDFLFEVLSLQSQVLTFLNSVSEAFKMQNPNCILADTNKLKFNPFFSG